MPVTCSTRPENAVVSDAKLLGFSRNTNYKCVAVLKEGRPALTGAVTVVSAPPRLVGPHE